mgnify:CR=1 FL=1
MRIVIKVAAILLIALTACANSPPQQGNSDQAPGNAVAAYQAFFFSGLSYDSVFEAAEQSLAQNGFAITNADKQGLEVAGQFIHSGSNQSIYVSVQFKVTKDGTAAIAVAEHKPHLGIGRGEDIAKRVLPKIREYSGYYG